MPIKLYLSGHYFEIMLDRNAYYHRVNRRHDIVLPVVTNAGPDKSPGERGNLGRESKIVVYCAHLSIENSVINRAMRDAVRDLPQVDFRDLHELYPDFYINTATEQALLRNADLIVFQHPIYWYAAPAIFKHFMDTVLLHGFAYGPGGTALHGKDFLLAVSTGAPAEEYGPGGIHHYPLERLMLPIEQTARFCGMRFMQPLVLHDGHSLPADVVAAHATRYRQLLEDYRPAG